jgi:excisionase family DNA binding protein
MKLIDIKSLSEILGVKASTLYQWVEIGKIPHYKLNGGKKGAVRFNIEEINNWLLSTCKIDPIRYNTTVKVESPKQKGGVK